MRKIKCGLIVSDFDGTLIDSNHTVSPEVRTAIEEYVACGGIFAVCTGRMLRSILPLVRDLGLKGLVAAYQGAVIADIETGKIIKSGGMPSEQMVRVCKAMEEIGCDFHIYSDNQIYTNIPDDNVYRQLHEQILGVRAQFIGQPLSEFALHNDLIYQKAASLVAPKDQMEQYEKLRQRLGNDFDVTCSANCLVEIAPINENKGEAVKFLAQEYGIPLSKTVAMGDNLNDLSMIKAAGIGVAVGNATDALKAAADDVTATNDEGAVAKIIKKYGFA